MKAGAPGHGAVRRREEPGWNCGLGLKQTQMKREREKLDLEGALI